VARTAATIRASTLEVTPIDDGTKVAQLADQVFIPAIDVLGIADDSLPIGAQTGENQRRPGPDVGGEYGTAG
jgi:hypothetical protein